VHQVDVEVVEARVPRELDRRIGLRTVVDAAQSLQAGVVEGLHPEADPVDAGSAVMLEAAVFGGTRIGFEGDLQPGREPEPRTGRLQECVDRFWRKQRRRAAAEE